MYIRGNYCIKCKGVRDSFLNYVRWFGIMIYYYYKKLDFFNYLKVWKKNLINWNKVVSLLIDVIFLKLDLEV